MDESVPGQEVTVAPESLPPEKPLIKYKIVAIFNFIFAAMQIFVSLLNIFFVMPKLSSLYEEVNIKQPSFSYLLLLVPFAFGFTNLFFGIKLLGKSREKYFRYAAIFAILTFLLGGTLSSVFSTFFIPLSVYNLTNNLSPSITSVPTPTSTPADETVNSDLIGANWKTYTSEKLSLTFTYLVNQNDQKIIVKENGNRICVTYDPQDNKCSEGQFLEVFDKSKTQRLEDAIKNKFLVTYSPEDCFIDSDPVHYEDIHPAMRNYEIAEITFPKTSDPNLPWWTNAEKCPQMYTSTNGVSYFLMDKDHSDKYLYFHIGQYGIESGNNKLWQDTVMFTP